MAHYTSCVGYKVLEMDDLSTTMKNIVKISENRWLRFIESVRIQL